MIIYHLQNNSKLVKRHMWPLLYDFLPSSIITTHSLSQKNIFQNFVRFGVLNHSTPCISISLHKFWLYMECSALYFYQKPITFLENLYSSLKPWINHYPLYQRFFDCCRLRWSFPPLCSHCVLPILPFL